MKILGYELDEDEQDVWDQLNDLPARVREDIAKRLLDQAQVLLFAVEECESPIEQLLAISLEREARVIQRLLDGEYDISPQFTLKIGKKNYRVDFLITYLPSHLSSSSPYLTEYRIVVECDGHEFHEKTKAQAQRDKARDREMQMEGIMVLRFTGSEIWKSPWDCAKEVTKALKTLIGFPEGEVL